MQNAVVIFFFDSGPIFLNTNTLGSRDAIASRLNDLFMEWEIGFEVNNTDIVTLMNGLIHTKSGDEQQFLVVPEYHGMNLLLYATNVFGVRIKDNKLQLSFISPETEPKTQITDNRGDVPVSINDPFSILEILIRNFHIWRPGKVGLWVCHRNG